MRLYLSIKDITKPPKSICILLHESKALDGASWPSCIKIFKKILSSQKFFSKFPELNVEFPAKMVFLHLFNFGQNVRRMSIIFEMLVSKCTRLHINNSKIWQQIFHNFLEKWYQGGPLTHKKILCQIFFAQNPF